MLKIFTRTLQTNSLRRFATKSNVNNQNEECALIQSKRTHFNLYETHDEHCKFGSIPLASAGWLHHKSKGDWFHINPSIAEVDKQKEMHELEDFIQQSPMKLDTKLIENLKTAFEIKRITDIQRLGWPKIHDCHHTLIAAETGCGKTLAYLLPIVQSILERKVSGRGNERKMNTPLAMILTPGRELAAQISGVAEKLCADLGVNVKCILGGNTKHLMVNPEFADVDIVIASMGALSKLVTTGIYRVDQVRHVVLDEADTLLDDSFSDKLVHILKRFPFHKNHTQSETEVGTQLILASATMPTNINELLHKVIDVETIHEVVSPHLHKLMPHVEQRFVRINKADRPARLLNVVRKEISLRRPVIIFSNKTPTCDYVSIFLNNNGINCINLNGDMLMKIRLGRFEQFQNAECDVLSTTDIGSRGLDTTRARHVINYDFPLHISDYIHRSGRIGRVGNLDKCIVTNLISSRREIDVVQRIEHTARCGGILPDVNANIRSIINKKIVNDMNKAGIPVQSPSVAKEEIF